MLDEVAHLLAEIPAAFWGVVVGSFFSLGGVALTNRANDKRLRAQLAHDRTLRNRDREFALRQQIYLDAIEAAFTGFGCLPKFAELDIADHEITRPYSDKGSAIARTQIIAAAPSARAINTLIAELTAAFMKLATKRIRLNVLKEQVKNLDNLIAGFTKTRDEMLQLMQQYNIQGTQDPQRFQTIKNNFEFEQKRIDEHVVQRKTAIIVRATVQLEIVRDSLDALAQMQMLAVPAILAIRDELEISIDRDTYTKMMSEIVDRQRKQLGEFMATLQQILQELKAGKTPEIVNG